MNHNSYLSLTLNSTSSTPLSFTITKAHIKESLESPFCITCEGYRESLEEHPFTLESFASLERNKENALNSFPHKESALNFHPNALINQEASFRITNPYPQSSHTLDFTNNVLETLKESNQTNKDSQNSKESLDSLEKAKEYQGILFSVEYLGLNANSSANVLHRGSRTPSFNHKHFFQFTLYSPLYRMSLNKANRIYTNKSVVEVIQIILAFYEHDIIKPFNFSGITLSYPKLELISQYEESDLDFITRLAHNNGIYFCDVGGSICFYDRAQRHSSSRELPFNPNINNTLNEPCISSVYKQQTLRANAFTQSTQNAFNPFALQSLTQNTEGFEEESDANWHSYSSEYSFTQSSDLKTPVSLQEKRVQVLKQSLKAQSNIYDLTLNENITLNFSSSFKDNKENLREFIIIAMEQVLLNEALLENSFNSNDNRIKKENAKSMKENVTSFIEQRSKKSESLNPQTTS
ncbi:MULTISPECIES: contractile injection system protein, VgrG/Pvc8 family, partial [unclassified Campylobacter]